GTADNIQYNFAAQDELVKLLSKYDIELLMTYSGTPEMLQQPAGPVGPNDRWPTRGGRSGPPADLAKWKEIIRNVTRHYAEIGLPFQVNQVWNEHDAKHQSCTV